MSALTYEVKDRQSPVAVWLSATFPQHKEIQAQFRIAAGPQRILMPAGVAPGTQGGAIDFWLRMLIDPQPSIALAVRFGYLAGWPLAELGRRMGGPPTGLADLRAQFAQIPADPATALSATARLVERPAPRARRRYRAPPRSRISTSA